MLKHYDLVHAMEGNFRFTCGVRSCPKTYKSTRSYQRHLTKEHKEYCERHNLNHRGGGDGDAAADDHNVVEQGPIDLSYLEVFNEDDMDVNQDLHQQDIIAQQPLQPVPDEYDIHRHVAMIMLNLREKFKVSESTCSFVAQQLQTLVSLTGDQVVDEIHRKLTQVNAEGDIDLHEILYQQLQPTIDACQDFASSKILKKYVSEHMDYVAPVELAVGEVNGGERRPTMQYIPILETLKMLLKHEDVLGQVMQNRISQDGVLRDFCDGDVFQNNVLFQQHRNSLQIQLYYDDFTPTNPIGSHSRSNKLSAIYFVLGNLHPKYRSQLDNIQLVALAPYQKVVAQHGLDAFFKPVVDDIKILENEGIEIECQGQLHHFYGTVTVVVADNLGAHSLAKLQESFAHAHVICRFCQTRRADFQGVHRDGDFEQRTKQGHDAQVAAVQQDDSLIPIYGVKGPSCLSEVQYYHVIDGLPSDIAHDLFEGLVPDITIKVLNSLVEDEMFTFEEVNEKLADFEFAAADRGNKPPPLILVRHGHARLKCTQSQMWCFVRILPFLVGCLVPAENDYWDLLLHMLDMIECVCAPAQSRGDVEHMRDVIEDCLDKFKELYPEENTKPKTHYITHYPTQTLKFGPLCRCWTIRFEGKHEFFKGVFNRSKNRKNVCKTMAERHQQRQALLHSSESLLDNTIESN